MTEMLFLLAGGALIATGFGLGWWLKGGQAPVVISTKPKARNKWNPGNMLKPVIQEDELNPVTPVDQREARRTRPRG